MNPIVEIRPGDFHQANTLLQQDQDRQQPDYENKLHREFYFAYHQEKPIAFYNLAFYTSTNNTIGELEFVFVSPESRNQHLGSLLTAHSALQAGSCQRQIFRVIASDKQGKIKNFLEKLGFQAETDIGKTKGVFNISLDRPAQEIFQDYLDNPA